MNDEKKDNLKIDDQIIRDGRVAAFAGPAILSNRFLVAIGPCGVRISFLEQQCPDLIPIFRAGVNLSVHDATELYRLLERMLIGESTKHELKRMLEDSKTRESKNHD